MNQSAVPHVSPSTLEVVALGGLGEFGMNMMAMSWGDTTVLIDAGVMFPEPDQLGVDLIIPDMSFVEARRENVKALILTHGHEDHIGAVPHVFELFDGPVYGTAMTLAFIEPKLEEHGIDPGDRLKTVKPRQSVTVGPFAIEFIRVTHSMPDCVALAITTPVGTIVHTGDFKIDQTPIDGEHFDLHRFAELGTEGRARALCRQHERRSPGLHRPGDRGHRCLRGAVYLLRGQARRRDVLVEHLSHAGARRPGGAIRAQGRVRRPEHRAEHGNRAAAWVSAIPSGMQIRDSDIQNYASQDVLCITTGSQGEPQAALPRIAIDDHRFVKLGPDDTVVLLCPLDPRQ